MNDPIYLPRPDYVAIAKSALPDYDSLPQWQQEDAVQDAQRAHLEVHVNALRESDLTPKQLSFRRAYQAFVVPRAETGTGKLINDATPVTIGSKKKKS